MYNYVRCLIVSALQKLVSQVADVNVVLVVELMYVGCVFEWIYFISFDDVLEMLDFVGFLVVKIVFDMYYLGYCQKMLGWVIEVVFKMVIVYFGDVKVLLFGEQDCCCLGEGVLLFK